MKRARFIVLFVSVLTCLCGHSKTNEYKLVMDVSGTKGDFFKSWVFNASSDKEANEIGIRLVNKETASSIEDYIKAKIEYNLYRISKNQEVWVHFDGYKTDIFHRRQEWEEQQIPLAYAGSQFGMSMSDVLRIEHFKNYKKDGKKLSSQETLGGITYNVNLYFDENYGLNSVRFTTPYESKNHLNTRIKSAVRSFSDIIKKANGGAYKYFDYPTDSYLSKYDNSVVARWVFFPPLSSYQPCKLIEVGVETNNTEDNYRMFAIIFLDLEDIQKEDASALF